MDLPDKAAIDGGRTGTGRWQVGWASQVGALHVARDQVREDAACVHVGDGIVIAAVSDGHGMARSFRAHVGSELAVEAARDVALDSRAAWSGPGVDDLAVASWLRDHYTPAVLSRWQQLVRDDVLESPFTEQERAIAPDEATQFIAYGATLVVALVDDQRMVAWQLGDGDLLFAPAGATAGPAVAGDPHLVGNRTTSLCQPDAARHVRTAVHELGTQASVVVLATDGFANAMLAGDWQERLGEDLHSLVSTDGFTAVARKLPEWAVEASRASGDDVSLIVLAAEDLGGRPTLRPVPPAIASTAVSSSTVEATAAQPPTVDGPTFAPTAPTASVSAAPAAAPAPSAAYEASVAAAGPVAPASGRRWLLAGLLLGLVVLAGLIWVILLRGGSSQGGPSQSVPTTPVVTLNPAATTPTRDPSATAGQPSAVPTSVGGPAPTGGPPRGTIVPTATQNDPTITQTAGRNGR
jgi:serine/threonine protein phosphatase PrpC